MKKCFFTHGDKREAKKRLGIPENAKHILMMCGSMGCGPMEPISEQLKQLLPADGVLTVVCGTNEKLRKKLEPLESDAVRICGFTDNVSELMDSADLYMTKPGGLSVTEAARKRLPLAFIDAVSGCEGYNRYFFLTRGMALASNDPEQLPSLCIKRLYDDAKLKKQRDLMEQEFTGDPAGVICDFFV